VTALRRGVTIGLAYALAVTAIEMGFGVARMLDLGMPPMTASQTRAAVLEIALGVVLGVLVAPLTSPRGGRIWALLALAVIWTALARWVAPDPSVVMMWAAAPVGGVLLVALGAALARLARPLPWAIGVLAVAASIVVPIVVDQRRAREDALPALPPARAGAPDVVLVVLDTVRAASTSLYGYHRRTTPTLERLASEGAVFRDATSPSTWSLPAHASLFTGWFPSAHGATGEQRVLGATPPTLAEVLAAAGYDTRCFTANPHISDAFGLTRGFRWSDRAFLSGNAGRGFFFIYRLLDVVGIGADDKGGADVAANFERWVAERPAGGPPAFAFLNFLEAHFPYHQVPGRFLAEYTPKSRRELRASSLVMLGAQFGRALTPEETAASVEDAVDMYDAGILYSDHLLERVVTTLQRAGRLDDTVLVVLADHGEMLGEHGAFGHGAAVYEPDVRVPFVLRYPRRVPAGSSVTSPVSTLATFATVLDLAGMPALPALHVGSVMPALEGRVAGAPVIVERHMIPDAVRPGGAALARTDRRYRTYRAGDLKLVRTSAGETLLFDLRADPGETQDQAGARPEDVTRLGRELDDWTRALALPSLEAAATGDGAGAQPAAAVDDATRERLRALGYVE
jgi:arylsulfatase A-like enzyme